MLLVVNTAAVEAVSAGQSETCGWFWYCAMFMGDTQHGAVTLPDYQGSPNAKRWL